MSSSAINTQVAQLKIGNVQNQADNSGVYSAGVWSFKNSTALTSVTITDAGNVGIGTASPAVPLDVVASNANALHLKLRGRSSDSVGQMEFWNNANSTRYAFLGADSNAFSLGATDTRPVTFSTNGNERMRVDTSGNLLVGTATKLTGGVRGIDVNTAGIGNSGITFGLEGTARGFWYALSSQTQLRCESSSGYTIGLYSGGGGGVVLANNATSWSPASSDERKKKNFETTQGLSEVLQIEPVKYHFNSEEDSAAKRLGFKAQNLQAVIPEMVHPTGEKAEDGSDYLTITPDYILPVLVKAIQELSAKVDAQAAEIEALKAKP